MMLVQLSDHRWPSGSDETIAILRVSLEAIARRHGLALEAWEEIGLGPVRGCWCRLPSGRVISLIELEYRADSEHPGPNLYVDSDELRHSGSAALLEDALDALGLRSEDVAWKTDQG